MKLNFLIKIDVQKFFVFTFFDGRFTGGNNRIFAFVAKLHKVAFIFVKLHVILLKPFRKY